MQCTKRFFNFSIQLSAMVDVMVSQIGPKLSTSTGNVTSTVAATGIEKNEKVLPWTPRVISVQSPFTRYLHSIGLLLLYT